MKALVANTSVGARRTVLAASTFRSNPLCRSLGTISSSRCQTTRGMRTLRGEAKAQARILVFLRTSNSGIGRRSPAGGARRDRTDDLLLAKQALSQLSYGPSPAYQAKPETSATAGMVGLGRFELPTSRLSSARSNQLSYRPNPYQSEALECPAQKPP
jgi:hypothetical protein